MVKCLPTMQETRVQSLGLEDPLEKEMATHSSILALKIPWTEEPGRLQSMWSQRVGHDRMTFFSPWGPLDFLSTCLGNDSLMTLLLKKIASPVSVSFLLSSFSSVQFSRSVMSDSLRPHEVQHARPPCLSPTPGVHSDSCPSSQ